MTTPHQSNDGQPDALVVIPLELRRAFVAALRNPCADTAAGVHCDRTAKLKLKIKLNDHHLNTSGTFDLTV